MGYYGSPVSFELRTIHLCQVIHNAVKKIAVVGTCGAGKTAFAKSLSRLRDLPYIELDSLYWAENWTKVPDEIFCDRVLKLVQEEAWVADGNYAIVRDLIWSHADAIIWLDYSFNVVMARLF